MRVLLIEDEPNTARSVELAFAAEGIVCDTVAYGEDGFDLGSRYEYDIIVLDMMLPDVSGFEVLKKFRARNIKTPVLILSGLTSSENKIKGLNYGADDYVTKPFNHREIIERIRAIVRRSKGHSDSVMQIGELTIDINRKHVSLSGKDVALTNKEYSILELMAMRKGTPVKKETFLNHLYGGIDEPELKIIDVFVCKLRKKLQDMSGTNYIETLWGRGYMLVDPNEAPKETDKTAKTA
jgi:two-component system cell cycle response regulator CtrA